jgi:excisionase family DNA binding protein
MPTHETLEGRTLTYETTPEQAAFLARVQAAAADPAVSENDLIALIYSPENPLLDTTMLPGRGMVTKAVFDNELYHVFTDYLGRKRVQLGALDLNAARARYTMTVSQAAERLGMSASAVHQAIQAWKLPAWRKEGQIYLDPEGVESFLESKRHVPRRGPPPRLTVRLGSATGMTLQLKAPGELENRIASEPAGSVEGLVTSWKRVGVLFGGHEGKVRFCVLEPGGEENEVKHGPFYVRGRFSITERVNNPQKARDAYKAFEAE